MNGPCHGEHGEHGNFGGSVLLKLGLPPFGNV